MKHQTILVLDFGSQNTQLIARRLRELSVYSEIVPYNTPLQTLLDRQPAGIILSGGPKSVSESGAPRCAPELFQAGVPMVQSFDDILGACERIRKTPLPFSYSSYIKQFVVLFAMLTPFALAREFGYGTVIASMFLFFSTMGIELLAGEVEEPFGADRNDLPLEEIGATIVRDVDTILGP